MNGVRGSLIGWVDEEYGKGYWRSNDGTTEYVGTFKNLQAEGAGILYMADTYAIKGGFLDGYYEGPMTISTNWGVTQNCYADS